MAYVIPNKHIFTSHSKSLQTNNDVSDAVQMFNKIYESQYAVFLNHSRGMHAGLKDDCPEILRESGSDLLSGMYNSLKIIASSTDAIVKANVTLTKNLLHVLINDSKKIHATIQKNGMRKFKIEGYEYTITDDIPDYKFAKSYVSDICDDVKNPESFTRAKSNKLYKDIFDGDKLNKFKYKLIHMKNQNKDLIFSDEVAAKYRNGKYNPISLTVDADYVEMIVEMLPALNETLNKSVKEKENIADIVNKYKVLCDNGKDSWYYKQVTSQTYMSDPEKLYDLNTYCKARCKEAASILTVVTLAYTEKILAIKEAAQLYKYIFDTVKFNNKEA